MANLSENLTAQMQELVEKGVALAIHAKNPQKFRKHQGRAQDRQPNRRRDAR